MKKYDNSYLTHVSEQWEYPAFKAIDFNKKRSKYCVCVFVINEGKKVQKQLKQMGKYANTIDIVIADGGSTDGSLKPELIKGFGVRTLLTKTGSGKLSSQMRMAFVWALNEGYEGVIVVDGNGKDDITAIPDFMNLLDQGYDHIQGSRFIKGGHAINTPIERLIAVKLIHAPLISIAARRRHTDTTNGFRAYSARLLKDSDIAIFRDVFATYELHYYLAIEASRRKQYKVIETPVTREYPKMGKTPTKISPIKGNIFVLAILFKACLGRYKKKVNNVIVYLTIWLFTFLFLIINIHIFYPGFMSPDSLVQLAQAKQIVQLTDWHPPASTLLWHYLIKFTGLTGSLLIFQSSLLWFSLGLFGSYFYHISKKILIALLPLSIGLLPFTLNISGVLWKDVIMAYALLFAVVVMLYMHITKNRVLKYTFFSIVLIFLTFAVQLRYNALVAVIPLLLYVFLKITKKKAYIFLMLVSFIIINLFLSVGIQKIYKIDRTNPEVYFIIDDYFNAFQGNLAQGSVEQAVIQKAQEKCNSASYRLNVYWTCLGPEDRKLIQENYDAITDDWRKNIFSNFDDYLRFRILIYKEIFLQDNASGYVWHDGVDQPNIFGLRIVENDKKTILEKYVAFFEKDFGFLYRPYLWTGLAILLIYLQSKSQIKKFHKLIYALCTSSILYTLSYIPLSAGVDYRYFYWSVVSVVLALLLYLLQNNKRFNC